MWPLSQLWIMIASTHTNASWWMQRQCNILFQLYSSVLSWQPILLRANSSFKTTGLNDIPTWQEQRIASAIVDDAIVVTLMFETAGLLVHDVHGCQVRCSIGNTETSTSLPQQLNWHKVCLLGVCIWVCTLRSLEDQLSYLPAIHLNFRQELETRARAAFACRVQTLDSRFAFRGRSTALTMDEFFAVVVPVSW